MTDLADTVAPTVLPAVNAPTGASIEAALAALDGDPRLVHLRRLPPSPAAFGSLARPLPAELADRLPHPRLWSHQARAIDLARDGRSIALASGTASGKSLCFQVPIAEAAIEGGTSLLVYPTKALAQDQLQALARWGVPGLVAATYDGDCTPEERTWVRDSANVVLTNPEMLHQAVLANHRRWAQFLHRLRFVVIDELHTLRGVFGTHVAQILRRLRRLVLHHGGTEPTFVFTSATSARRRCSRPRSPAAGCRWCRAAAHRPASAPSPCGTPRPTPRGTRSATP